MDEALVEHAEHDVDRDRRGQDQPGLAGERLARIRRRRRNSCRSPRSACRCRARPARSPHGVAERRIGREVEADGGGRELLLVGDDQRRGAVLEAGDRAQRHHRAARYRGNDRWARSRSARSTAPAPRCRRPERRSWSARSGRSGTAASPPGSRGTGWPARRWSRSGAGRRRRSRCRRRSAWRCRGGRRSRDRPATCSRKPSFCASEATSRSIRRPLAAACVSLAAQSSTSFASVPVSVYWYCARLSRVEIWMSCTGWK